MGGQCGLRVRNTDTRELDLTRAIVPPGFNGLYRARQGRRNAVRRGSLRSPNEHDLQAIISISRCGNAIFPSNVKVHGSEESNISASLLRYLRLLTLGRRSPAMDR